MELFFNDHAASLIIFFTIFTQFQCEIVVDTMGGTMPIFSTAYHDHHSNSSSNFAADHQSSSSNMYTFANLPDSKAGKCGISPYQPPPPPQRAANVINGHRVPNSEALPWMAVLFFASNGGFYRLCTATIISNSFLLTAAHCIAEIYMEDPSFNGTGPWPPLNTSRFSMMAGSVDCHNKSSSNSGGGQHEQQVWRHSKRIYPHPGYRDNFGRITYNDIALIELEAPALLFTDTIKPICLNANGSAMMKNGELSIVAGWGALKREPGNSTDVLHDGYVYNLPAERCKRRDVHFDDEKAICASGIRSGAGGGDPCHGDSGGPLLQKYGKFQWVQLGVVCGSMQFGCWPPDVFTRISHYCAWIANLTGIECI